MDIKVLNGSRLIMQIAFERDGGFAGILLSYYADTDELPREVAEELLKLIAISGFFDLQPDNTTEPTSPGPPDTFQYRLSLSEEGRNKSLLFNDIAIPVALRPLLNYLQKLAHGQAERSIVPTSR